MTAIKAAVVQADDARAFLATRVQMAADELNRAGRATPVRTALP